MGARNIIVATQGALDEVHRRFVATARAEHAKVMRTDPRPTRFERYVDGKLGAPEASVRANGVITYLYPRLPIVVQYAMEMLFRYSPVKSGDYRRAHTIFLNGQAVADLAAWKAGDEVAIINFMPYARKIELGAMSMTVPGTSQVFEQAIAATNRKYRSIARALHTWRVVSTSGQLMTKGARASADLRYPAIVFREV